MSRTKCYKELNQDDNKFIDERLSFPLNKKERWIIAKKFQFLRSFPEHKGLGVECCVCKKAAFDIDNDNNSKYWEPDTNYVRVGYWWFSESRSDQRLGYNRSICAICLCDKSYK